MGKSLNKHTCVESNKFELQAVINTQCAKMVYINKNPPLDIYVMFL